jgi:hypothetical protein
MDLFFNPQIKIKVYIHSPLINSITDIENFLKTENMEAEEPKKK